MVLKLIKKGISLAMAFAVVLSLSCCGGDEVSIDEIPTETTETTTEAIAETLSEEELDELVQNMPEIVFVMSNHLDNTNIIGLYMTNTGEVKMFDFREIAPDEIYEIPDVYDRLEEATCSEINFYPDYSYAGPDTIITENDLIDAPYNELLQCFVLLQQMNEDIIVYESDMVFDTRTGHFKYYGVKNNVSGEKEFVLLSVYGEGDEIGYYYSKSLIGDEIFRHLYDYFITRWRL